MAAQKEQRAKDLPLQKHTRPNCLYGSVDGAVEEGGELLDFRGEVGEFFGEDGLHAVGEGFFGLVVDFDEQSIGADGDCGAGEGKNFVTLAGAVAGVNQDWKVAALFDGRDDGEVERIAGKIGEGADTAFAEHDVVIALGENVFCCQEEFVKSSGHAAFEKNGELGAAGAFEEREVLHVARTDLDDIGVFLDEVEGFTVDGFGDDAEAVVFADFGQDAEAGEAESLEAVRRSARLISATAE